MMTYALVALGGAIGSVLRYAIGALSVAAWGNSFPWGTILINMTGSFLIGLVAAATLADGVLPANPALRLFIMVGFCGGYTTFSSFSLQTLELARDGRPGAALLNVMLSLLLCFVAVAIGYYAAAGLGGRPLVGNARRTPDPVVLAVLERPDHVAVLLSAASQLAEAFGRDRIEALAIRLPPQDLSTSTEEIMGQGQADRHRQVEQDRVADLRRIADRWTAANGNRRLDWSDPEGGIAHLVRQAAQRADIVVLMRPLPYRDALQQDIAHAALHAALFDRGRPILMLPPASGVGRFGRRIAVAWNGDQAAHAAVMAALPLLRRAERVVLLSDMTPHEPPPLFREQGIGVDLMPPQAGDADGGARLLRAAHGAGADLLVMGAFTHSAFRERRLGGVTRHVIDAADIAVFMQR